MSDQDQQQNLGASASVKDSSSKDPKTFYRKASSLAGAFEESVDEKRPKPLFNWGSDWYVTEKVDGSQFWITIVLRLDGTYQVSMKSHGGHPCFPGADAEDMTIQKLQSAAKAYTYQGADLTKILPSALEGFINLMGDTGLTECHFYCELTLPGATPCQLAYLPTMKSRLWLFNQVYFDLTGERVIKYVTPENKVIYDKYNIPTVPLLMHGNSFSLADFEKVLDWCDADVNREGAMLYQPGPLGNLLKIKTHHGVPMMNEKPHGLQGENSKAYDLYMASLAKSQIISRKREKYEKDLEKARHAPLTSDEINEEVRKEFTHDSHEVFLQAYKTAPKSERSKLLQCSEWYRHVVDALTETYGTERVSKSTTFIFKNMTKFLNNYEKLN